MWVVILSGNQKGQVLDQQRPEAESNVATGYARWATRPEWERFAPPKPAIPSGSGKGATFSVPEPTATGTAATGTAAGKAAAQPAAPLPNANAAPQRAAPEPGKRGWYGKKKK